LLNRFGRLPSIDFSTEPFLPGVTATDGANNDTNNNYPVDPFGVSSYLLDSNRYGGAALSSINSFDFAAASVSAPGNLKSFKSFDASLFAPTETVIQSGTGFSSQSQDEEKREFLFSDRVTILPDEQVVASGSGSSSIGLPLSSSASTSKKNTGKAKNSSANAVTDGVCPFDDLIGTSTSNVSNATAAANKRKASTMNTSNVVIGGVTLPPPEITENVNSTTVAQGQEKRVRYSLEDIDYGSSNTSSNSNSILNSIPFTAEATLPSQGKQINVCGVIEIYRL
jgi:hypothetical protein